jgi:hypothetical protein
MTFPDKKLFCVVQEVKKAHIRLTYYQYEGLMTSRYPIASFDQRGERYVKVQIWKINN